MAGQKKNNKLWAILIGSGLALSPIHNQWLTGLTTTASGEVWLFLPIVGYLLIILGSEMFLIRNWDRVKESGIGSKQVYIPLLVIVAAIGLSGITATGINNKLAPLFMACALFSVYLVARTCGIGLFRPLGIGALVAAVGIILYQLTNGTASGGYIFERNYDIATGYIFLGTALLLGSSYQWTAILVATVALILSGSTEAVFAMGILALTVVCRKDYSKQLITIGLLVIITSTVLLLTPRGQQITRLTTWAVTGNVDYIPADRNPNRGTALQRRFGTIREAMSHIKPLGEGYNLTNFSAVKMVHNVPLVIVQQLGIPGILAAIAWLWVSFYCLLKTRWKYAWVSVLALSVFDHYTWTQLGVVWWGIVGASITSHIKSDFIFKRTQTA